MASRSMFPFGSGRMFLQLTGTDLNFFRVGVAAMQEGGWNLDVDVKELHGANRWPVDVRTGMGKIEGTAKFTDWDADIIARMLGTAAPTAGVNALAIKLGGSAGLAIPGTPGPYTIVVDLASLPGSGTYSKNLEVTYGPTAGTGNAAPGNALKQVAAAGTPVAGEYKVTAGTYTFAVAEAGYTVNISCMYTLTGIGKKVSFSNVAIGTTPVMAGVFQGISDLKQMVFELDYVVPHGMKWGQRIDDWSHQDISLKAFASPDTDVIGRFNLLTA